MTHTEVKELFEKKIFEAKSLIENTKNSENISIKPTLFYCDDNLVESEHYDGKSKTSLLADLEIRLIGRDSEDDPMLSIGLLCDLKRDCVENPDDLSKEITNFDNEITQFITGLSSAESTEEFVTSEFNKINEENEQKLKEMEEKLDKLTKYMKIGAYSVLAVLFIVLLIKALMQ